MPNTDINWEEVRRRWILMGMPPLGGNSLRVSVDDYTKCSGDIQTLTTTVSGGTAPYTYLWSPSTGLSSTTSANPTASHTSTVTYTVVVTDANGRTATDTSVVTVPTAISATISSTTNVLCYGNNTGAATVVASNGTSPYTYLWHNGVTTAAITGLTAGIYGVTVSDACSNTARTFAYVTQPAAAVSISFVSDNNLCYGAAGGAATASATGGTGSYSYSWSNGSTNARITGLTAGTYVVTVTDGNSCSKTASVTITEPADYTITSTITGASSVVTGATAGLSASAVNATGTLTWAWTPTASIVSGTSTGTPVVGPTQATTYQVIVTDGCGKTASAQHAMTVTSGEEGFWFLNPTTYLAASDTYGQTGSGATAFNAYFNIDNGINADSSSVAYLKDYGTGNGRLITGVVNQSGAQPEFLFSDDLGTTWTGTHAASSAYQSYKISHGKTTEGINVLLAISSQVSRSIDGGMNWTAPLTSIGGSADPVFSGSTWSVAMWNGDLYTATASGETWTSRTKPNTNEYTSGCYGDGTFVYLADTGTNRVVTSQDGITWTARTPVADTVWIGVAYSPTLNMFVAVGRTGTYRAMYSTDKGVNWSPITLSAKKWSGVAWSPKYSIFLATVGEDGANNNTIAWSSDGINWSEAGMTICNGQGANIAKWIKTN